MIINQDNISTLDRINELLNYSHTFDCFVGYFHVSGFHQIYKSLEKIEKIRILIGIATGEETYQLIQKAQSSIQNTLNTEVENEFKGLIQNPKIEKGIQTFIQWIKDGKLEIRAYPKANAHAKLYIFNFSDDAMDRGRIITGSSNLTYSALNRNIEIDVELHDIYNLKNARNLFNNYWQESIEINHDFVDSIQKKTWFNAELTPYEFYLKLLYEYFYNRELHHPHIEQKYLLVIKTIQQINPDLFEQIKNLSSQLRIAKESSNFEFKGYLLSGFLTNCKIQPMRFFVGSMLNQTKEISFDEAIKLIECEPDQTKMDMPEDYFILLEKNKDALFQQRIFEQQVNMTKSKQQDIQSTTVQSLNDIIRQVLKVNRFINKDIVQFFEQFLHEINTNRSISEENLMEIKSSLYSKIQRMPRLLNSPDQIIKIIQSSMNFEILPAEENLTDDQPIEYEAIFSIYLK